MKTLLRYSLCIILLFIFSTSERVCGQNTATKSSATAAQATTEIKKLRDAVEAAPDDLEAHKAYIRRAGINNPALVIQYDKWIQKYPQKINIPLAIGEAFYDREQPQAKKYLLKVTELAPGMAKVWFMLSIDAGRWGQQSMTAEYMKKASLADTTDAGYAYYYASTLESIDPDLYKQKVLEVVKRFPGSERGAQGLYWLAERSTDSTEKIRYFEQLHTLYPPKKSEWSKSGMESLWGIYITSDPEKALSLANEIGDDQDWKPEACYRKYYCRT